MADDDATNRAADIVRRADAAYGYRAPFDLRREIADAIRAAATAPPAWSSAPPTAEGWYWCRDPADREVEMAEVVRCDRGLWWVNGHRLAEYAGREWSGPLAVPPG